MAPNTALKSSRLDPAMPRPSLRWHRLPRSDCDPNAPSARRTTESASEHCQPAGRSTRDRLGSNIVPVIQGTAAGGTLSRDQRLRYRTNLSYWEVETYAHAKVTFNAASSLNAPPSFALEHWIRLFDIAPRQWNPL